MIIAPKSSIIAKAVRNTFKDIGTLEPNSDNTPNEKAMSVAEGIAHPLNAVSYTHLTLPTNREL